MSIYGLKMNLDNLQRQLLNVLYEMLQSGQIISLEPLNFPPFYRLCAHTEDEDAVLARLFRAVRGATSYPRDTGNRRNRHRSRRGEPALCESVELHVQSSKNPTTLID
jgi:hypothetical protein